MVSAVIRCLPMFLHVIGIMAILCSIFALFSKEAYIGTFTQKCIVNQPSTSTISYIDWVSTQCKFCKSLNEKNHFLLLINIINTNKANWYLDAFGTDTYYPCTNGSSSNEGRHEIF